MAVVVNGVVMVQVAVAHTRVTPSRDDKRLTLCHDDIVAKYLRDMETRNHDYIGMVLKFEKCELEIFKCSLKFVKFAIFT